MKALIKMASPDDTFQHHLAEPVKGWVLFVNGNFIGTYGTSAEAIEQATYIAETQSIVKGQDQQITIDCRWSDRYAAIEKAQNV